VYFFAVDLDAHEGQNDFTKFDKKLEQFFGASPVRFYSKSGKGIRQIYLLETPIAEMEFLECIRSWGFNRRGRIEIFPKTEKLTQFWLPNEPNISTGGDSFIAGTWERAIIPLPEKILVQMTNASLDFLLGFVEPGNRNSSLFSTSREFGNKRIEKMLAERLCRRGAILCGLNERETGATIESGFSQGLAESFQSRNRSENELKCGSIQIYGETIPLIHPQTGELLTTEKWFAERIANLFGEKIRFNQTSGKFLIFNGKHWANDEHGDVHKFASETNTRIFTEINNFEGERTRIIKALLKFEKLQVFRGALGFLEQFPGIRKTENEFDRQNHLFNCQNGTLNLSTGAFKPHNPIDNISKISEAFFNPDAKYPLWQNFMNRIFNGDFETIFYLQKAVGISLLGDVKEQCFFFCFGRGANGKSVFFETLALLFGSYYQKAPSEMLMLKNQNSSVPNDIARLKGSRFVVASELQDGLRFNEAVLKNLTGGDSIPARFLYKEFFEFKPTHKLWIYGNHRPVVRGSDDGVWRRIKLIPFLVQIPVEQRIPLPELVASLSKELSGILNWALEGLNAYRKEGLKDCKAVREATAGYREESDSLGDFLNDCIEFCQAGETKNEELYPAYQDWCKKTGEYPYNSRRFCSMMRERGLSDKRGAQGSKIWKGITIKW
jgi:P4 family phage/plasmid primase-like protien